MPGDSKRKVIRRVLKVFKWCRIALWLLILAVLAGVLYLHLGGMPGFVKTALQRELRARGIDAEFSRAYLGWTQEIIIEGVAVGRASDPLSPSLSAGRAEARLSASALFRRRLQVDAFKVSQGRVRIPTGGTNEQALVFDKVELGLRFLPGDIALLENGRAVAHGLNIRVEGVLTNFSAVGQWALPVEALGAASTNRAVDWRAGLRQGLDLADAVVFSKPPELRLSLSGDARAPDTLRADARLEAESVQAPWGGMSNFSCRLFCSKIVNSGPEPFATLILSADRVRALGGEAGTLRMRMAFSRGLEEPALRGALALSASPVWVSWPGVSDQQAGAGRLDWEGTVLFNSTNYTVGAAGGTLRVRKAESPLGTMEEGSVGFEARARRLAPKEDPALAALGMAARWDVDWRLQTAGVSAFWAELADFSASGVWRAPQVVVERLNTRAPFGGLNASARLDVLRRRLTLDAAAELDPRGPASLLGTNYAAWVARFSYEKPPAIQASLAATLPAWDAAGSNWTRLTLEALTGSGAVSIGKFGCGAFEFDGMKAAIEYTNGAWQVARADLSAPEGWARLSASGRVDSPEVRVSVEAQMDPKRVVAKLADAADIQSWLDQAQLPHPPRLRLDIHGNWRDPASFAAAGALSLTNFTAFDQAFDSLETSLAYSNQVIALPDFRLVHGEQFANAAAIQFDLRRNIISFDGGEAFFDVQTIFKSIDSVLPEFLQEIAFDAPVRGKVGGWFSTVDPAAVDLSFQLAGDHFRWTNEVNLRVDRASGDVHWVGRVVSLTNVDASLYGGGQAQGWAFFDWRALDGTVIRFDTTLANVDLPTVIRGLSGQETKVEGKLHGHVLVDGNCLYSNSWHGDGSFKVSEAVLWDIPVFGVVSPLLNTISDGLGNSRAHQAYGDFVLTNGVLRTENTVIEANGAMQLRYRGEADMEKVNATVEARVLSRTPLLGPILSLVEMPFSKSLEWRVEGPLKNPVARPAYPTGLLLDKTLHPFRTLWSIIPSAPKPAPAQTETNSAPAPVGP